MSGGWQGSDRRSRLPSNWASEIVLAVKRRAGGQCEWLLPRSGKRCPRPGKDVDHKVAGDDHSMRNLRLLCEHHHDKKTAQEGVWGRYGKKKIAGRPAERHPGAVS